MRRRGKRPRDRVRDVQTFERSDVRKHRIHPDNAEQARARERDRRREHTVAQPAVHAGHRRHRAVQHIGGADDHHADIRRLQLVLARGIQPQHLAPEDDREQAHHAGQHDDQSHRPPGDRAGALIVLRADVLAHGGGRHLHDGVLRAVEQSLDAYARAVSGDDRRAERVDGRLNNEVGNGEERPLQSGGNADLHHFAEDMTGKFQLPELYLLRAEQAAQREIAGHALAEDRCDGNARHVDADDQHKKEVHHHVQQSGNRKIQQRLARVAERTERCGGEVIERHDRQTQKVNTKIHRRERQHLVRAADEPQQRHRERKPERPDDHAADNADNECRRNGTPELFGLVRAVIARAEYAAAGGKSHKDADNQVDHRAVRADRRHGVRPPEPPDNDKVGGVEGDLQHGRDHQRQNELQHLRQERSLRHIDLISLFHLFHLVSNESTYYAFFVKNSRAMKKNSVMTGKRRENPAAFYPFCCVAVSRILSEDKE